MLKCVRIYYGNSNILSRRQNLVRIFSSGVIGNNTPFHLLLLCFLLLSYQIPANHTLIATFNHTHAYDYPAIIRQITLANFKCTAFPFRNKLKITNLVIRICLNVYSHTTENY